MFYFAYGSNMRRARLEARVGAVEDRGLAVLRDYCHLFAKQGRDGTAKGTVLQRTGAVVYGVLYGVTSEQLATLDGFEGGYRQIEVTVTCAGAAVHASSFQALRRVAGLVPTAEYLEHYRIGMEEHGAPEEYRRALLGSVG